MTIAVLRRLMLDKRGKLVRDREKDMERCGRAWRLYVCQNLACVLWDDDIIRESK